MRYSASVARNVKPSECRPHPSCFTSVASSDPCRKDACSSSSLGRCHDGPVVGTVVGTVVGPVAHAAVGMAGRAIGGVDGSLWIRVG
ncbi:putative membrane protein [Lasius niger]|uniref:Putative membrane protein n=1 Tax=Lasius niger TaxID=67767 RepID=A0A0J7MT57_LASNI|nr:putative membrane protein [Lasius niger]